MDHGACRGSDPALFYPNDGNFGRASRMCKICPVQHDCLEYALANNERLGIWGGVSERGRARIRQARRAASDAA